MEGDKQVVPASVCLEKNPVAEEATNIVDLESAQETHQHLERIVAQRCVQKHLKHLNSISYEFISNEDP